MLEEKWLQRLVSKMPSCSRVILRAVLYSLPHLHWPQDIWDDRAFVSVTLITSCSPVSTARTFDSGGSLPFLTSGLAAFTRWEARGLWAPVCHTAPSQGTDREQELSLDWSGDCSQDPGPLPSSESGGALPPSFSFLSMAVAFLGSSSIKAFMELGFHKTQRRWQHHRGGFCLLPCWK